MADVYVRGLKLGFSANTALASVDPLAKEWLRMPVEPPGTVADRVKAELDRSQAIIAALTKGG